MSPRIRTPGRSGGRSFSNPGSFISGGSIDGSMFASLFGGGYATSENPQRVAVNGAFRVLPQTEWECGFSFQAPPSGNLWVEIGIRSTTPGTAHTMAIATIRTGDVIRQGTVVFGGDFSGTVADSYRGWGRQTYLPTGLTPGAMYNIAVHWIAPPNVFPVAPTVHYIEQRYVIAKAA